MQREQLGTTAGRNGIGLALFIAEFDERSVGIQQFNDGADLPAGKPLPRNIR